MTFPQVVYAMQHRVTKKIYIGLTSNLASRYRSHMSLLRKNKHHSKLMQKEYNEYGGEYDVFILDKVEKYTERCKEREWMQYYQTKDKHYGYNTQGGCCTEGHELPLKEGKPERLCESGGKDEH